MIDLGQEITLIEISKFQREFVPLIVAQTSITYPITFYDNIPQKIVPFKRTRDK